MQARDIMQRNVFTVREDQPVGAMDHVFQVVHLLGVQAQGDQFAQADGPVEDPLRISISLTDRTRVDTRIVM